MNLKTTNELSIIIVNWNGRHFLSDCLKSIVENPSSTTYQIIIVDNASTDGSVKCLQSVEVKDLLKNITFRLIESKENLGFGRANNLAIEQTDTPYVFLLNPDTIVKPHAINNLLETLKSDSRIGAVAPKLLNMDGTLQYNVWGFPLTPLSLLVTGLKIHRLLPKKIVGNWLYSWHWNYSERKPVPIVSGAAIMAKRELINDVGVFDPDFFMYGEDWEWCVRMNKNGWKTFFEPAAEIIHLGGLSSIQQWGKKGSRLKEEEAILLFQKKCLPRYLLFANLITRIFLITLYLMKYIFLRKETSMLVSLLKLHFNSLKLFFGKSNTCETNLIS